MLIILTNHLEFIITNIFSKNFLFLYGRTIALHIWLSGTNNLNYGHLYEVVKIVAFKEQLSR